MTTFTIEMAKRAFRERNELRAEVERLDTLVIAKLAEINELRAEVAEGPMIKLLSVQQEVERLKREMRHLDNCLQERAKEIKQLQEEKARLTKLVQETVLAAGSYVALEPKP
jgi:predicted RNase H-like nuclease (RuvC/YqgF family)